MEEELVTIAITPEAYAVINEWIKAGDLTISQAIINHAPPKPLKKASSIKKGTNND